MAIQAFDLAATARRQDAKLQIEGANKRFGSGRTAVQALLPIDLAIVAGIDNRNAIGV